MANGLKPVVLDISHHQTLEDDAFVKMKKAGIQGVIHKATEASGYVDKTYAKRRVDCEAAGVLWGAYHFARGGSPDVQVDHFLRYAKPDQSTLLALDWEDKAMTAGKARRFLEVLMQRTGRRPDQIWIYTGHVGKELIKTEADKAFFSKFPLWLCHYTTPAKVKLPDAWESYGLWQYSESGSIAGIKKGGAVDLNVFGGKNLKAEWAAGPKPTPVPIEEPEPKQKQVTPKDLVPVSTKAWRSAWIVRVCYAIAGLFSLDSFMEWAEVAQRVRGQVSGFVSENSKVLVIVGAIVLALIVKSIWTRMAEDVNEGRAVPSGGLPQK